MSAISRNSLIRIYRRYAPLYDYLFGAILEPGRRRMTSVVNELSPQTLLEVGVGTGLTLAQYPSAAKVLGIDISPEMLAKAQARVDLLTDRDITLRSMDAEHMDFPDNMFDCVTVPYVLSVTPDTTKMVAELRRVCKKGCTILILNHFSGRQPWRPLENVFRLFADKVGFRSDFSFEDQILTHDWRVTSVSRVNVFGLSKLVVIVNE